MIAKIGRTASLALAFILLGFLLIGFAWNGAASVDCAQCQIPYLLSGGAGGLGLIGLGIGLLIFEAGRRGRNRIEQRMDELIEAIREPFSEKSATSGEAGTQPSATSRGAKSAPAGGPATKLTSAVPNGSVIVGRTSFHRPDCRLVEGKEDLDYASQDDAVARGLTPCRVCDPLRPIARTTPSRARARR